MHIFYTPDVSGDHYSLNEEESRHCIRVLRLKQGDKIALVDGRGGYYTAAISLEDAKKCLVTITEKQQASKRNYHLHIAIAPTKNMDRMEWFLEKAIEIGLDEFTPLICERSERREIKTERLEKIAIAAIKQSGNAYFPKINQAMPYSQFIKQEFEGLKMIAHCLSDDKKHLKELYTAGSKAVVLVGPEGDFSNSEVSAALNINYQPINLGQSRLRTETAGMYICAAVNLLNE
jgi:16S rRNA (uracil1498-N3)-methyltransferase